MPFGLSNAGATFQRAMQLAFDDLIGKIIQIYLDDLTVYSKIRSDHFGHLRKVLMRDVGNLDFPKPFQVHFWCYRGKTPWTHRLLFRNKH
jgi:hypothetical protein